MLVHFAADESGGTATEYGLVFAGIGLAIVSIVAQVGSHLGALLDSVVARLTGG